MLLRLGVTRIKFRVGLFFDLYFRIMLRGIALSIVIPVLLFMAVIAISRSSEHSATFALASKKAVHKLAQSHGLLGDYENWKQTKDSKAAEGLILDEPKLHLALDGLNKIKVKKGSKRSAAFFAAQAELKKVLAETASDQQLGQSAIEGTES